MSEREPVRGSIAPPAGVLALEGSMTRGERR